MPVLRGLEVSRLVDLMKANRVQHDSDGGFMFPLP